MLIYTLIRLSGLHFSALELKPKHCRTDPLHNTTSTVGKVSTHFSWGGEVRNGKGREGRGVWKGRVQYSVLTLQLTRCFSTHARGWKRFATPVHYATSQNTNTIAEMKGAPKHYCTQWIAILHS